MSPEQLFHGKDIDHRGDLWSVAVVTYFALTGTRPFRGKTLGELAIQIKGASFQMPTELRNDLPADVDTWFARALHPDLAARFTTAKEMAQQLEAACGVSTMMTSTPSGVAHQLQTFPGTTLSSPAMQIPYRTKGRAPVVIGVVLAMTALTGVTWVVLVGGEAQPPSPSAPVASHEPGPAAGGRTRAPNPLRRRPRWRRLFRGASPRSSVSPDGSATSPIQPAPRIQPGPRIQPRPQAPRPPPPPPTARAKTGRSSEECR